ncbi:alkaline phosphatase D family protein [Pyxidicoccus trucidator]|uniref:alkaline phosphatase D family protein n=1 Tax=Pyxidicoccus trucidator TaxID=2709662 RepID=UPI001F07975D|nr:alkaline phosphatase D family protein [Pyxidicoccus trucidator]
MFDKFKRRSFLQAVVAVAASTSLGCAEDVTPPSDDTAKYFPQSVASGDPRADSVVLWVRAVDPDNASANTSVKLEVSTSEDFSSLFLNESFSALAANDHALKVKVTGLSARTTYYYRFTFEKDGQKVSTRTGRTRTAPAAGADVPVKFAFASCQDYIGRYYNAWQRLLQLDEDLDFVVFLGDYVYETTGDASFQDANGTRSIVFSEPEKAQSEGTGMVAFFAASALSNYRDLYKSIRKDPVLQQIHERYPFIIVWDDHEFSDDCWGSTATYTDGRRDEKQDDRRKNAEQAFFEYIPLDNTQAPGGAIDIGQVVAAQSTGTKIWRDFEFGQHLKLLVADTRTNRPDHLIPEDAYPGSVVIDAATLGSLPAPVQGAFAGETFAYVDIDAAPLAQYKQLLQGVYVQTAVKAGLTQAEAAEKAAAWVKGNVSLFYVNQVIAGYNQATGGTTPLIPAGAARGVAFVHMGKPDLFGIQGSRYIVVKPVFELYAGIKYAATQGKSEDVLGAAQQAWFQDTVKASNTWKIVVSSVSMTPMVFDLSQKADVPEANLRQSFYFNVDQWDGFPTKRAELLKYLRDNNLQNNTMFVSGDIHASFVSVEGGVPALTAPAISSGSIKELAGRALLGAGYGSGAAVHKYIVQELEASLSAANPNMKFADGDAHGFVVLEVKKDEAVAAFHLIPSTEIAKDYTLRSDAELAAKFTRKNFRIKDGGITVI